MLRIGEKIYLLFHPSFVASRDARPQLLLQGLLPPGAGQDGGIGLLHRRQADRGGELWRGAPGQERADGGESGGQD